MKFKLLLKPLLLMGLLLAAGISEATTDKYRIMWRDDPATTMVISWNQASGHSAVVHYGTTDEGTNANAYPNTKTSDKVEDNNINMENHFARLTGLQPNTAYYFVIKDNEGTSERFWFKTTPDVNTERLSFIAGGDSRNNRVPRVNANKLVAKLRPHAVLFGGDFTDRATIHQWADWLDDWQHTIGADGRMIPIVATQGNHEGSSLNLSKYFDLPNDDVYYAFTFGGDLIRAYTLNTEITIGGDQTNWLAGDLAASNDVTWRMAQYHKGIRPHVAGKAEGFPQYVNWAPLFEQHKVQLVVECDAHTVKTTWPIVPSTDTGSDEGFIQDDCNGTVYVGEGCWGAPLRANDDPKPWTRDSGMFNQFKWIFVDQQKIEVRTIIVDNADLVGQVNDNDIFPANLDIWNPANGSLVTITGGTGFVCDDGDVCTINDELDANCDCTGTFQDTDGDGVCDANDQCPGGDDNIDNNNNGIPDDCEDICPTDLIITNADVPGDYEASNSIETDETANLVVNSGDKLTLSAGRYVELNQGFDTQPGGNLDAYIEGCTPTNPKLTTTDITSVRHYPNPFSDKVTLEFNLDTDAGVVIRIVDVKGTEVSQVPAQTLSQGYQTISISTENWIPGTYFYQVFIKENNNGITKRANGLLVKM